MIVSIIIPVYNAEKFVGRCVESILSQTFQDFEILLVDDGSKDESLVKCKELQQTDARIRVFSKENGGPSSARKLGVKNAKGEFVFFVDADDTIPMGALSLLIEKDLNMSLDIIQGARKYIPVNGAPEQIAGFEKDEIIDFLTYINYLFQGYANAGPVGTLYRRSLFGYETFNLPNDVRIGEDFYMNLCMGIKARTIGLYNIVVYNYLENSNSATHTYQFVSLTPQIHLLESLRRELNYAGLFEMFSQQFYSKAIGTLVSASFHNRQLIHDPYCLQIVNESRSSLLSRKCKLLYLLLKYPFLYYIYSVLNRLRKFYRQL